MKRTTKHGQAKNVITDNGDGTHTLLITRTNGNQHHFTFDSDQLDVVQAKTWRAIVDARGNVYAGHGDTKKRELKLLHRLLAETPDHLECRFSDHDLTNLRRDNLINGEHFETMTYGRRACNAGPKSGQPCVSWEKRGVWVVRIKRKRVVHYVGHFRTIADAVKARDAYLAKLEGRNTATKTRKRVA